MLGRSLRHKLEIAETGPKRQQLGMLPRAHRPGLKFIHGARRVFRQTLRLIVGISLGILPATSAVKVAFIGDSITEGSGLANPATESYPAKLQRLLGSGYTVGNFGVSGRTLLRKGDFPYWKESAYTRSREFQPDIVFLLLGTNDSKPQNWRHSTNFLTDFEDLITSYATLSSAPRIILGTPPPVFKNGAFEIRPAVIANEVAPLVRQLASQPGREVLDLHDLLADRTDWFPDTVHPDSRGTSALAALIWEKLTGITTEQPPMPELGRVSSTRVALTWPVDGGGWVVESSPALLGVTAKWGVASTPVFRDGLTLRQTNTMTTAVRYYRLIRP